MSAILRHRQPNRFTVLPNDAIRNPALSFRAVGVLAHLLSLPDGAKVDSATLAQAHKEGRDAIRAAYKELEAHGYYRRDLIRLADGTLRTEVVVSSTPMNGEAPGHTGAGKSGVGPEPGNPAPAEPAPVGPTSAGPTPDDQAPTEVPTTQNLLSPQTPRIAGGQQDFRGRAGPPPVPPPDTARYDWGASAGVPPAAGEEPAVRASGGAAPRTRRQAGTNPRALGAHPRAAADLEEAARLEAEATARQAQLERTNAARRAADLAAQAEANRIEGEALAVSAALDDRQLGAVVDLVTERMAGPLARSPLAISRAVVAWCRTAVAAEPGPLSLAVALGLSSRLAAGEGSAPLELPPAPADGTVPLRHRIASLRTPAAVG